MTTVRETRPLQPFIRRRARLDFRVGLLLAALVGAAAARAETVLPAGLGYRPCSIEEKSTPLGAKYSRFTGLTGLRTDILYAPHMDPVMLTEIQALISTEIKNPTHLKAIKELAAKIKATHRDILVAKRRELMVLDELTKDPKIRWLGVELPDTDVNQSRKHIVLERIKLEKALTDAGVNFRDSDDLVLLMNDSIQYWLTSAPDRIKTYSYVGIENEKAHGRALKSAEQIEKLNKALREYDSKIQTLDNDSLKTLEHEIGQILGERRSVARASEKTVVQRFPSSESRGMAESQIQAARDLVLASRRRDQLIAERINHNIAGHGILTMGRAHQESLAEFLVQTCERRLQEASPAKSPASVKSHGR